jgi:hypothetical protein
MAPRNGPSRSQNCNGVVPSVSIKISSIQRSFDPTVYMPKRADLSFLDLLIYLTGNCIFFRNDSRLCGTKEDLAGVGEWGSSYLGAITMEGS